MRLKYRLLLLVFGVLALSVFITWFGIKPGYEKALVEERIQKVSQLHTQILNEIDLKTMGWIKVLEDATQIIENSPDKLETSIQTYIRLFPDIQFFKIIEENSSQFFEVKQRSSITDSVKERWKANMLPSPQFNNLAFNWLPEDDVLYLSFYFEHEGARFNLQAVIQDAPLKLILSSLPISETFDVAVWANNKPIYSNTSLEKTFSVEPSPFQRIITQKTDSSSYIITYQSFRSSPFTYSIALNEQDITAPIRSLFERTLLILVISLLIIGIGAYLLTTYIEKPIKEVADALVPFGSYNFTNPIKESTLPDFKPLSIVMEEVRAKLYHYQQINIDKLIAEEQRNRLLMRYATQMVAILDQDENIAFSNEKLNRFFQDIDFKLPNNWSALSKSSFIDEENQENIEDEFHVRGLHQTIFDWTATTLSGNKYTFKVYKLDIRQETNAGSLIIFYDLTDELNLDLKRNELISIIVHELRNPVSSIIGFAQLLQSNATKGSVNESYSNYIINSASEMNQLIGRFLQISRLESKAVTFDKSPIYLPGTIQQIHDSFRAKLLEKVVYLQIDIQKDASFVIASESLFIDALKNLVSNAIKYGESNRTIHINVERLNNFIVIRVTDYGLGIDKEHFSKIFEKFYRIKSTQGREGTGLGLAYVKEIMNRHNGEITVESSKEFGSRFSLFFPIDSEFEKELTNIESE